MFRSCSTPKVATLLTALLAAGALSADGPKAPGGTPPKGDDFAAKVKELQAQLAELAEDFTAKLKAANVKLAEVVQHAERAQAEAKRRQREVEVLQDVVRKREAEIAKAEAATTRYRDQAVREAAAAKTALQRALNLLNQLRVMERQVVDLQKEVARLKAGAVGGGKPGAAPLAANPPPNDVKGIVLKVDANDPRLVEVSLGTDAGVKKGHTLEVYRLKPPQYVGRIHILDAAKERATGRLMTTPAMAKRLKIEVGDEVASTIR
jgi:hypothetical protein